jgi:hypothetical protein
MRSTRPACQCCETTDDPCSAAHEPWVAQPDELRLRSPWSLCGGAQLAGDGGLSVAGVAAAQAPGQPSPAMSSKCMAAASSPRR